MKRLARCYNVFFKEKNLTNKKCKLFECLISLPDSGRSHERVLHSTKEWKVSSTRSANKINLRKSTLQNKEQQKYQYIQVSMNCHKATAALMAHGSCSECLK